MGAKSVVVIAGPTAVGKTGLALQLAQHFGTKIISADSRQCYRELKVGVARPSSAELASVRHYFIASHSIHQPVTAATFEQYALEKAQLIFQTHDLAILVGGTGLYINAFCDGMDALPDVPEAVRREIRSAYEQYGLAWLQEQVRQLDPKFYASGEIKNPHRLLRALEVYKATGSSILNYRTGKKAVRDFRIIKIGLHLSKEQLYENIHARVDVMVEEGLLDEVRSLIPYQHLNALQTVGYRELFAYFNGEWPLPDAIAAIKKNTRQYAKRQMTWFRKDAAYAWFNPVQFGSIAQHLANTFNT